MKRSLLRTKMPGWAWLPLTLIPASAAFVSLILLFVPARAAQTPRLALDMVTADDIYNESTNSMTIGSLDNCLTTAAPGNNAEHTHIAYLVVQGVEDMIGWQARLNYDGGRMRPATVNTTPFSDTTRGQNVSFTNMPIDPATGVHRDPINASTIPPAAPGPQTAAMGAIYAGAQNAAISPDTPSKSPPDDTSYSAPNGGVVAAVSLQVMAGQVGQPLMTIDLDDGDPNPPGSGIVVFTGQGTQPIYLAESDLFDGYHTEGTTCVPPVVIPPLPGATGVPGSQGTAGASVAPGSSPGGASASAGASPGSTRGASRTASPSASSPGSGTGTNTGGGSNSGNDDGGTPAWVYVLLVAAAVGLPVAGFFAWRNRERLPWFRGT
jgi:hypothetical protein